MNYIVIDRGTDGKGRRWVTVALADGTRSTHYYTA